MTPGDGKNKRLKKVAVLLLILLLPSFFYVILDKGEHHYRLLPFIGETQIDGTDTIYHTVPQFQLTDQNGETFTNAQMEGKICVVDFFFTRCPSICPKMAAHLLEIQNKFQDRDDVIIVSHTVDPGHDDVEALAAYAKKVHAESGKWYFLTGEKAYIYDLANRGYFAPASEDETAPGGFLHSNLIFLVDKKRRVRGTYDDMDNVVPAFDGTSTSAMKKMADAIDNLLLEAYVPKKNKK